MDLEALCAFSGGANTSRQPLNLIIAGSAPLQAALGERWVGADIDLFCSSDSRTAPKARQFLIEVCNLICAGNSEEYRWNQHYVDNQADEVSRYYTTPQNTVMSIFYRIRT